MNNIAIKIIIKKEKADKSGNTPIYIRVYKNARSIYFATGRKINIKYWDLKRDELKSNTPNKRELDHYLKRRYDKLFGICDELERVNPNFSLEDVKDKYHNVNQIDDCFISYFENHLADLKLHGKYGSLSVAEAVFSKLQKYLKGKSFKFNDLTVSFLKKYEQHLRTRCNNKDNTIHRDIKKFRKLYNDAVNEGIVKSVDSPFKKYKLPSAKTKTVFLKMEELNEIKNYPITPWTKKWHHRNMFLFAASAGGIRISDILQLKWKNVTESNSIQIEPKPKYKLEFCTQKTSTKIAFNIPPSAVEILSLYKPITGEKEDNFIFPILTKYKSLKGGDLFKALSSSTAYANKNMKEIAEAVGINKKITFHTSRHTFATLAVSMNANNYHIMRLLGHSSMKQTLEYVELVGEDLNKTTEMIDW
jgi:integrase/recombinase XerD